MADPNTEDTEWKLYNEILTPSELFAARSRSHKIPVRGQKDFFPDDSEEQRQRLQQSLTEHWSLVSEERVEKLGNLVKATWIPSEGIVELQSPAGKFWQTMGFSVSGKQLLLPEEALYLMECGNLQVFHLELPLSVQDGYERFLSSSTVSLLQYQVFGHLKRLGFVVHRFDPSCQPSSYERQLNLSRSCDRAGNRLKRKRSDSPKEAQEQSGRKEEDVTPPETSRARLAAECSGVTGGTWWLTDVHGGQSGPSQASGSSHWDFSSILFPDVGSMERQPGRLASPDPSLLPGSLAVGVCDVAPWRRRINLRQVKTSLKEQRRQKSKQRRGVNKDREVRRCRNWTEYRALLERRRGGRHGRPAHLWNRDVTPLHEPGQPIPTVELLDKISVIRSTHLLEGASRLNDSGEWRICFNVYQPESVADFRKSDPGGPYARVCVCSFGGPVPDLRALKTLGAQSGDVSLVFAVVDHGDISFYTFKDFTLPTDVFP
ncbi:tRNA-splicing endonuclease subunit Sen54 [Spinachia spinachia]